MEVVLLDRPVAGLTDRAVAATAVEIVRPDAVPGRAVLLPLLPTDRTLDNDDRPDALGGVVVWLLNAMVLSFCYTREGSPPNLHHF